MELPICPLTGEPCVLPKYNTVTDINKDGVKSVQLCANCLPEYVGEDKKEDGKPAKTPMGMAKDVFDFLESLVKQKEKSEGKKVKKKKEKPPCPACGMTVAEISEHKKLGCPHCYKHYGKELEAVLESVHGDTVHVGKVPKNKMKEPKPEPEDIITRLTRKMDAAVAKEDYEAAAIIRDELMKAENAKMQKQLEAEEKESEEKPDDTGKDGDSPISEN
tara:strand:- start:11329 stop:11982 length:654 start_codon:yes stop_codon:yes gene_type:complete